MKKNNMLMTLCHRCKSQFENSDKYYIKPVDKNQSVKEICTYCNSKDGYDYELIPKKEKENV